MCYNCKSLQSIYNYYKDSSTKDGLENSRIKYKGVSYYTKYNKYVCKISVNKKQLHLGYFNTDIEAAKAYDRYVIENKLERSINFN